MPKQEYCVGPDCQLEIYNKSRRLCKGHYGQWYRGVDPLVPLRGGKRRSKAGEWTPGYMNAHHKVRQYRGYAKDAQCANCGWAALDWALLPKVANDPETPREQVMVNGPELAYSMNPADYRPLCRGCHHRDC